MTPPPELVALVARVTGMPVTTPPVAAAGGFSHLTFHLGLGGRACVVKAASVPARRDEVRNEVAMLRRVVGIVPVPEVVALVDEGTWTAVVTVEVAGVHGFEILRASNLPAYAERLGCALGAVHAHGLVHGDAGFHNTLWDGRGALVALLDWEWGGDGPPLVDLAWVWWTMQFRSLPTAVWDGFVSGYGGGTVLGAAGWESGAVLSSVRAHLARHLARVEGDAALTAEWHRRRVALDVLVVPGVSGAF